MVEEPLEGKRVNPPTRKNSNWSPPSETGISHLIDIEYKQERNPTVNQLAITMVSREAIWRRKQRQLRKELATTEWRIEPGGHVTQWAKNADQETVAIAEDRGKIAVKAWKVHKTAGYEVGNQMNISFATSGGLQELTESDLNVMRNGSGSTSMIEQVIAQWPDGVGMKSEVGKELKRKILDTGIRDMESLLASKKAPVGQDYRRHLQVLGLLRMQKKFWNSHNQRADLALKVADTYGKGSKLATFIMRRERDWIRYRFIAPGFQGKHGKIRSMLDDEGTLLAAREYLAGAGQNRSAQGLADAVVAYWKAAVNTTDEEADQNEEAVMTVEETLLSLHELDDNSDHWSLTSRAAVQWMHRLGLNHKQIKKGLYKDGHEEVEVVRYRQETFLPFLKQLEYRTVEWDANGDYVRSPKDIQAAGHTPLVLITHDETTIHANDGPHSQWVYDDENPLRKKGLGQGIMLSDFLSPISRLSIPNRITNDQVTALGFQRREAQERLEIGGDIWWNGDLLEAQVMNYALPIFELQYPGCQALFLFDNARNHQGYPTNALRTAEMNLRPGGISSSKEMRNGWFYTADGIQMQSMNFEAIPTTPTSLIGTPKGIRVILQERGLWPQGGLKLKCGGKLEDCDPKQSDGCCARTLLAQQPDFLAQKTRIQEAIEAKGHLFFFWPKFHCELNWIEYFWGNTKWHTRYNCKYSLADLRTRIPKGIQYAEQYIWKNWNRTRKICDAYRDGIGWGAEKVYKSHRQVTSTVQNLQH